MTSFTMALPGKTELRQAVTLDKYIIAPVAYHVSRWVFLDQVSDIEKAMTSVDSGKARTDYKRV